MSPTHSVAKDGKMESRAAPSQQLNRSCESCRALKVRCLPDANLPNQCQRCARAKRTCIFVAPQRRRPRKRTDSRVAQLEKEMAAMRTALKGRRVIVEETLNEDDETGEEEEEEDATDEIGFGSETPQKPLPPKYQEIQVTHVAGPTNRSSHDTSQSPSYRSASQVSNERRSSLGTSVGYANSSIHELDSEGDVIGRGIISLDTAEDLVSLFAIKLLAYFPFIVLPAETTARHLRKTKPVLFLAILAASSIAVDVNLANILNREMLNLYAQRFFFKGEKSLEMVQALLSMNIFYLPPDLPSQIQSYQYSHIAATMALEIGIASKKRIPRRPNHHQRQSKPLPKFDEQMAEQARTILACYHLASNVAMRTRRPNILVYNDWIKECVRLLSRSPIDSDKRYASWFGLQVITDEALTSFGLDDTSSTTLLSETRVNGVLRLFDKKIEDWKEDIDPEYLTVPMMLEYQYTTLVVYELGIGEGYRDPDAIERQYYTLPAPDGDLLSGRPPEPLSGIRVDLTIKWMHAAHGLLNTFLHCDVHTMREMPNLHYSRTVLGLMALLKIYFSVKSGALGEVIRPDTVKVEYYLESLTQRLTEASSVSKYPIPSRWLHVVGAKAREWLRRFQKHCVDQEAQYQSHCVGASIEVAETAAPSTSTLSHAWHGGIVPTPTPTVLPGMSSKYTREYAFQHQQQRQGAAVTNQQQPHQLGTGLPYSDVQGGTSSTTQSASTTTATATTTTTDTYPDYSHTAAWLQPPLVSSSPALAAPAIDPHVADSGYQLPPQAVWTFAQQQHVLDIHNQHFPPVPSNNNGIGDQHGMYPMEMEFDWIPEHGMFQLPSF